MCNMRYYVNSDALAMCYDRCMSILKHLDRSINIIQFYYLILPYCIAPYVTMHKMLKGINTNQLAYFDEFE